MVDRRLAVGFADLVGFTRLTRRLEEEELGELVESFETTAADLVAAHGGRLIKTLGDEVLFAADDAGTAAEIALRLIEAMGQDETMPALRVGIAFGTVTTRMGDVFGTTVNLASRLTSIAPKDAVLVDGAFAAELVRHGEAPESEAPCAGWASWSRGCWPGAARPAPERVRRGRFPGRLRPGRIPGECGGTGLGWLRPAGPWAVAAGRPLSGRGEAGFRAVVVRPAPGRSRWLRPVGGPALVSRIPVG